jgi:hypothetical protein
MSPIAVTPPRSSTTPNVIAASVNNRNSTSNTVRPERATGCRRSGSTGADGASGGRAGARDRWLRCSTGGAADGGVLVRPQPGKPLLGRPDAVRLTDAGSGNASPRRSAATAAANSPPVA